MLRTEQTAIKLRHVRRHHCLWMECFISQHSGPGEVGHETWAREEWKGRTGVNVWSTISVDIDRDLVFLADRWQSGL